MINVFLKRLSYDNRMELISSERVTCGCLVDRLSSGGHDSDEPAVGKDMRFTIHHENTHHVLGCRALVTCLEPQMTCSRLDCGCLEQ